MKKSERIYEILQEVEAMDDECQSEHPKAYDKERGIGWTFSRCAEELSGLINDLEALDE